MQTIEVTTNANGGATVVVTPDGGSPRTNSYSRNQLHTQRRNNKVFLITVGDEQSVYEIETGEDVLIVDGVTIAQDAAAFFDALEPVFFRGSGVSGAVTTETDAIALAAIATLQQQLDETEIIARSDTLQAGEPIAEAGTLFDAAGRRWVTVNPNAFVPDPLTVAALQASADFEEFVASPIQPSDISFFSGSVDADSRLDEHQDVMAVHFQTLTPGAILSTTGNFSTFIDGVQSVTASQTLGIPEGVQGFFYKTGTTITVVYTTMPDTAQDWRTQDFSQDTTTDGIGDTVWRFFNTSTAPRTLSIDSAEYNGGAQKIVKNNSNTHDLTVNFVTGSDRFVLADNSQVASITVRPGEVYTMSRNSGTFWNVTSVYSRNTPAEIFTRLSTWQRVNNAAIVRQGEIGGIPTAILTDFSGSTSHYRSTDFLPLTTPHTAKLRFPRDPTATTSILLRTSGAGTQELIINLDTGDAFGDNSGAGVDPVIDQTQVTDDEIIVWATFQPNAGITQWDLFPAVGPNGITDGTGFNSATQGTLEIFELDLNATLPVSSDVESFAGTNPAARLELTNNTLQSELSLVLGDLGISVDGVAIMPMTSADYTQGGITAVTADSTNWTRASTGNGPTDTNVGFENVPQGRYRYTFSIPEQEDDSTVDANDVADNDRPFPVILVNGVPAKLHADNTYIEHDDGSTSEYHSSGTIVVPEGGSVQLGLVIEGGDTEEFEFQSAVITTEQGVDAIYGFFEIEKIDRPIVVPAVSEVTQQLAALQNQFDINDIVLTTIPDLQFDVKSGETWVFEVNLLAESLDATADLRAGTIAPTGSTGRITFVNAENATVRGADINDATLVLAVGTGTDDLIQIKGIVNAGGDGVVQFQLRNNTGTVLQSFRADSWVEAKRIP